jgi:mRNA-degrading endonuclease toxin of MazEF toxin-antitoxin module
MLRPGDTIPAGSEDAPLHLWVVITQPLAGEVAVVSITTKRARSETLVTLRSGGHPFIQHDSVVAYAYAAIQQVEAIERALESGRAIRREPLAPELLARVQAGLLDSDRTPNQVRAYCRYVLGAPD